MTIYVNIFFHAARPHRGCELAAITRRRTRIAACRGIARGEIGTSNAPQYQA
jgi:hypothetical protein